VRIYAATKNLGKLEELRDIFEPYGVQIAAWDRYQDPEETADSYEGNARIKARALHEQLADAGIRENVLADDSGLEIAALGGRPGVQSARYGGPNATWAERRAMILCEVAASGSDDRRARFVCVLCCIDPDGAELIAEGFADGELSEDERGRLGFAYDPIFYDPSEHATFAELSDAEKNKISHRAKAAKRLMEKLKEEHKV
jgi:XTP/dITP diphosphohydrolase